MTSGRRAKSQRAQGAPRGSRARREAERRQAQQRRSLALIVGGVTALAAIIAIVVSSGGRSAGPSTVKTYPLASLGSLARPGSPGPLGPERIPIPAGPALAGTTSGAAGAATDAIQCLGSEQTLFHVHTRLAIFIDGKPRQIPAGIGIVNPQTQNSPQGTFVGAGACLYWLHTHADDGIIHIEAPVRRVFTLGDFFDIWGQPLSADRLGPVSGPVVALYNGRVFRGDPATLPLGAQVQIQLEVGTPLVGPQPITFQGGL